MVCAELNAQSASPSLGEKTASLKKPKLIGAASEETEALRAEVKSLRISYKIMQPCKSE
jgi:hypothetical protein